MSNRDNSPLMDELAVRRERAKIVDSLYSIERTETDIYTVTYPDEIDRSYTVDLSVPTCTCPDFVCTVAQHGIYCKHVFAVQRRLEKQRVTGFPRHRPVVDAGFDRSKLPTDRVPTGEDVERAQGDPFETV